MAFKTLGSFNIQFCVEVDLEISTPGANLFALAIVKSEQFITFRAAYFFHAIYLLAHGVHSTGISCEAWEVHRLSDRSSRDDSGTQSNGDHRDE